MQKKVLLVCMLSFMMLTTASCTTSRSATTDEHDQTDTFEGYNRAMFKFNYEFDKYILKPLAEGYRDITTPYIRRRVNTALANLKEPLYATNNLLQGEFKDSGISLFRLPSTLP